jgi:hypothetical protein
MSIEQFFIREKANEGKKLPLFTPDGKATEHWLVILSQWSDAFLSRRDAAMRAAAKEIAGLDEAARKVRAESELLQLKAALVSAWSFDLPCTGENVVNLLKNAPQIAERIDQLAADDRRFFVESPTSTSGPETKESSVSE